MFSTFIVSLIRPCGGRGRSWSPDGSRIPHPGRAACKTTNGNLIFSPLCLPSPRPGIIYKRPHASLSKTALLMSRRRSRGPRSAQGTTAQYTSPAPGACFFLTGAYGSSNAGRVREPRLPLLPAVLSFRCRDARAHAPCALLWGTIGPEDPVAPDRAKPRTLASQKLSRPQGASAGAGAPWVCGSGVSGNAVPSRGATRPPHAGKRSQG